jgi:mono/diheme cytochrome c family protein
MKQSLFIFGFALIASSARGEDDATRLFRERVAPLLEKRCVACHSGATPKGKLALTTAAGARRGGESGPAVVPHKPDESVLLDAVIGAPPAMPQKAAPLTPAQVADLRVWIAQGAPWPDGLVLRDRRFEGELWWAVAPLSRPDVPITSKRDWERNPLDAFILARLESEGLSPSSEADARTLIRRLTFDLTGLPPTPDEVDAFLSDRRPDAYERLVDRLFDSPRFGERWARHWLDVAHYGDTHGYDKDKRRDHAWPYRDWVIRALNADLPYDRFVRLQIAGDALAPDDPNAVAATGFIAAGPWDFVGHQELREGTVDKLKTRALDRDDMVSNVASSFLSLTVHCARCHDHKFDPIPQADYYRLQAVFAGVDRGDRDLPDPLLKARRRELASYRAETARELAEADAAIARTLGPALGTLDSQLKDLRTRLAALPRPAGAASPTNGYHSSIHPAANGSAWVQVDLGAPREINEIRLIPARPTDFPDTPGFGFPSQFIIYVSDDPTFPVASSWVVEKVDRPDDAPGADEPYVARTAARGRYVRVAASGLWKRTDDYVFALAELEVYSGGANVARDRPVSSLDSIESGRWSRRALVDGHDSRHALPPGTSPDAARRAALRHEIQQVESARRHALQASVPEALRGRRESLNGALRTLTHHGLSSQFYGLISHVPRPIALLNRGDVEQPGALVDAGALSCLSGLEPGFTLKNPADEASRRVALADWIASPANVLTWRSAANRLWHYHFGRGIVDTPNDFGRNGSRPSHPALLDWLAVELRDHHGSLKHLHRLIVTSAAYRQSSAGDASKTLKDADNRLLWRQNRRRLEAEAVRDAVLSVSGTLDPRMYGPGFDLFRFKDDHSPIYDHTAPGASDNPAVRRRTVYRFTVRSVPNPFLDCMDAADPNLNVPSRPTTITALQALALWNDSFMIGQSRALASRLHHDGDPIATAYRLALGRPPRDDERAALAAYAKQFGLEQACRVLLNTNEFLFID